MSNGVLVETKSGPVMGSETAGIFAWKGIPFAAPPEGKLRFQPPHPSEPWTEPRSALTSGPAAPQIDNPTLSQLTGSTMADQSEDCLYLNVWSPGADHESRPVMVWIHGGSYLTGSGSVEWYDGTSFARDGDVVVVTINYRLGVLGFLHLAEVFGEKFAESGNLGLLDQVAALQWVRDNIANFGGDPERVTIFGESAGAGSVASLLALPAAKGLFQQAILQSGSGRLGIHSVQTATETARRILQRVGVNTDDPESLQTVSTEQWLQAAQAEKGALPFGPVLDGKVLPHHPMEALKTGEARDIPVMIGTNLEEFRLFTVGDPEIYTLDESGLRSRLEAILGPIPDELFNFYAREMPGETSYDRLILLPTYMTFVSAMLETIALQAGYGAPIWAYRFDWKSPALNGRLGACHALEIPFVFGNLDKPGVGGFTGGVRNLDSIAMNMHQSWIAFARTGTPNAPSLPEWPQCTTENQRAVMVFGSDTHVELDPYAAERNVWAAVANTKERS